MIYPLLLEINTRCWLRSLSDAGDSPITLANVPDAEFRRWKELGLTHLWLMGVWPTGPRSRAFCVEEPELRARFHGLLPGSDLDDFAGSPYAIAGYSVDTALGGEAGLKIFRKRLNACGIKLVLDFIANHVGFDHPWVSERPELFVQSTIQAPGTFEHRSPAGMRRFAHGRDPYFPTWLDTVQLDYRRPETRAAMLGELRSISRLCDGVRCDLAMLQLNTVFAKTWAGFPVGPAPKGEFWADTIANIKSENPDFLFLAEAYWGLEPRLQSLGFDYTYDKRVYDFIVERRPADLQHHLTESSRDQLSASAHFLENHDEVRIASVLSPAEHRAAALLTLGLPGMRMLYEGQMDGRRLRVPVQFARWPNEPVDHKIHSIYQEMIAALKHSAVGHGEWTLLRCDGSSSDSIFIIQWQKVPGQFDLVVVNLAAKHAQCRVRPEVRDWSACEWNVREAVNRDVVSTDVCEIHDGALSLELSAHAAYLLRFSV
jgi:hypothetical protein